MLAIMALAMQAATALTPLRGNPPADALPWPTRSLLPSSALLDRMEAQFNGKPCIGDVHRWQRTYWYPSFTDRKSRFWLDFGTIIGSYKDADGVRRIDRRIMRSNPINAIEEDGAAREAVVVYRVDSGKAKVTYCGFPQVD